MEVRSSRLPRLASLALCFRSRPTGAVQLKLQRVRLQVDISHCHSRAPAQHADCGLNCQRPEPWDWSQRARAAAF